jgi:hypothetical protein
MNIEEHKENLKKYIEEDFAFREPIKNMSDFDKYCYNHCQDIKEVLNELDKKDKVIDMMAECIDGEPTFGYGHLRDINTPEKVKKYFYNKIGGYSNEV